MTLAAVMPLPEGLSELLFGAALGRRPIRMICRNGELPIYADADFCITGTVIPGKTLKEGPFGDHLAQRLPAYACPVFVRICATLDNTETFKQKKQALIGEGFDPDRVKDQIFFKDPSSGAYRPVDAASYAGIMAGAIRV